MGKLLEKTYTLNSFKFENGDKVILRLGACRFVGYESANVIELFYGEKFGPKEYNAYSTEYFPPECIILALRAFDSRVAALNPMEPSDMGFALPTFLNRKSFKE